MIVETAEDNSDEINLHDIPGGPKAFEICAKFCYGMIVTLSAYNVAAARCAAEYLEMSEDIDKGNLVYKIEVFLNSSVLCSWKDSIIVLQTTKSLLPWSEELKIVGRCIDSIASKTSVDPSKVNWSFTHNKESAVPEIVGTEQRTFIVPKDWWVEDICELDVNLYKRVMVAVKSKGRMSSEVIGEALKAYAVRWLPDSCDALISDDHARRSTALVETIICLLPSDKGSGCSCRFLLKLLKVVILVGARDLLKEELMNRISVQFHMASVKDLLIPTRSPGDTIYDVRLVQNLATRFILQYGSTSDPELMEKCDSSRDEFILGHGALLSAGKLIDGYLAEVAGDPNLPISSFVDLSVSVPEAARPVHDGLYTAIDIYLMEHPNISKPEKKKICSLMDVRKLSSSASIHAAQNERLPLRVVVQVVYFEQLRAADGARAIDNSHGSARSTVTIEDPKRPAPEHNSSLKNQLRGLKIEDCRKDRKISKNKGGAGLLLPSRSRRIFDKLWVGKGRVENNPSSENSHSPPRMSMIPGEHKSTSSSSRHRRHSVS